MTKAGTSFARSPLRGISIIGSAVMGLAVLGLCLLPLLSVTAASPLAAQSLRGSRSSLDIQNAMARRHDFTFLRDRSHVQRFVSAGLLVRLRSTREYEVHRVSFPYTRPETALFIRRLAGQYLRACGEKLVVTSLTRPWSHQPRNASDRSVHPTGMAVDLRRSNKRACRSWLENTLLYLEGTGVLEATRERWPPHYHVAIFPNPYERYVEQVRSGTRTAASGGGEYRVRSGDSLWEIAQAHGVTVDELRLANRMSGSKIYPGQLLEIPAAGSVMPTRVAARSYEVRRGDSLWEIARAHSTTVDRLRRVNNLRGSRIHPGQLLKVPSGD